MPNVGETTNDGLTGRLADAADRGVYTTFVGVGVDANLNVIDAITAVKGANYYGVRSPTEFRERLDEEFAYVVTPLAFDVSLSVTGEGYDLANVYGTTAADLATGEVLSIRTLFPAPTEEGRVRGGVVLAELADAGTGDTVEVTAEWTERDGTTRETTATVTVTPDEQRFDATGVRKAVLLTRYATLLKNWTRHERGLIDGPPAEGIAPPPESADPAPREQQSESLRVTAPYADRLRNFREHFAAEAETIGDEDLQRELDLLETILDAAAEAGTTADDGETTTAETTAAVARPGPTAWR
jgi:Ca-activated chloride channel family protein